ncbi:MAG: aminotransferase [Cenarchaeum symbiont of Oopsacas minuta]|nr:aminotransferase [Cenarchaeum symbiont of Oopsacas minuta]
MRPDWLQKKITDHAALDGYIKPKLGDLLRLDSNENLTIPKKDVWRLVESGSDADLRKYPLGMTEKLIVAIEEHLGVPNGTVGVGSGSDQILDLLISNFATTKTRMLVCDPTFSFFEQRCRLYGIKTIKVPFTDNMKLSADSISSKKADILYLDVPNNPTGFAFTKKDLEDLVRNFEGLVIIDEAYAEFGGYTLSTLAPKLDNLVVTRTFSKAYGMAGLRLGYLVTNTEFADVFNRVIQYPYPVSTASIYAALELLSNDVAIKQAQKTISQIKSERARMLESMRKYDTFDVFDSDANFILFDAHGASKRVHTALEEQGIEVRNLGRIGEHTGCLRVTVGTREMNSKFLLAIRDLLQ